MAFARIAINAAPAALPPGPFPAAPPNAVGGTSVVVPEDGAAPLYVTGIEVAYHTETGAVGLPRLDDVRSSVVVLGAGPNGLVSPMLPPEYKTVRKPIDLEPLRISEIGKGRYQFLYPSAIHEISDRIFQYFNQKNVMGVFVRPDTRDLIVSPEGEIQEDKRQAEGRTTLRFEIFVGRVAQIRTIASGDRIPVQQRIDNPKHAWIKDRSPVFEATKSQITPLRKDELDSYVLWLNQHPGRHVDVSISSANRTEPEAVILDYLIAESKPWLIYGQISNTGTEQTNKWRERIGFTHNQLTNHDDILTLDYITAGFEDSYTLTASYEAPLAGIKRARWRIYGLYDEFTASDVGQSAQDFSGETEQAGAELIFNILQRRELFLYAVAGGRFERVKVNNETANDSGKASYAIPYVGLRLQDIEESRATLADVTVLRGMTNADTDDLEPLGRSEPDGDFTALQANVSHAFFLEPIFRPDEFRANKGVLAQEIALSLKAQYIPGARVIPQQQQTAGGFYTVRGYPESVSAGDSVVVASAEYRFHIPRSFKVQPDPKQTKVFGREFRMAPQQPYGRPDWDLIPRAFVDIGRTINNDALFFEKNNTLLGAGLGIELQYKQNVNLRVDWGVALREVDDPANPVSSGSNRLHISCTVLY